MSNKVPVQNPLSLESSSKSELLEGGFYVVKRGELVRLERSEDDLPTVPMSQAAKDALLEVRRQCRKALGGYRPDVALVATALVLHACGHCDAQAIVVEHFHRAPPTKSRRGLDHQLLQKCGERFRGRCASIPRNARIQVPVNS